MQFDRITHSIHRTRVLNEKTIPHGFNNAPVVTGNARIDKLGSKSIKAGDRTLLVLTNEAAVAYQIGCKNSRKATRDPRFIHSDPPSDVF